MSAVAGRRPRISEAFLRARRSDRVLDALARCIVERGYRTTTVADVVTGAGVARNTFYDCFGSKDEAGGGLIKSLGRPLVDACEARCATHSAAVMALEVAAFQVAEPSDARAKLAATRSIIDLAAAWTARLDAPDGEDEDDPLQSTLPPGRHGLPAEFVRDNQRRRLDEGTAWTVSEVGCGAATIADITRHAEVSRRTFYEHFDGRLEAVHSMVGYAETHFGAPSVGFEGPADYQYGAHSLWAEIVAAVLVGDPGHARDLVGGGRDILTALGEVIG